MKKEDSFVGEKFSIGSKTTEIFNLKSLACFQT